MAMAAAAAEICDEAVNLKAANRISDAGNQKSAELKSSSTRQARA